ncbi:hypothetical protein EYF80_001584 [Liparis tanakae]|uniref:Uncharacterized protein n=1 Tax=Liparis tanakae TaxID=230148 RepID=A0A4Z2JE13_9TELE|nr:hypothetical protein EYF80_001584 [Liparis tanakae]
MKIATSTASSPSVVGHNSILRPEQVSHQVSVRTSINRVPVPGVRGRPVGEAFVVLCRQDDIPAMRTWKCYTMRATTGNFTLTGSETLTHFWSGGCWPCQCHQNHSLPNPGTENTPQWTKMPTLASSYHEGSGLASRLVQFAVYRAAVWDARVTARTTAASMTPTGEPAARSLSPAVSLHHHAGSKSASVPSCSAHDVTADRASSPAWTSVSRR